MLLTLLCIAAFFAGFVDSIAGGGGLIQIPALLFLFPQTPLPLLLGTNKFASFFGTSISSFHYVRALKTNIKIILPTILIAFLCAILGAKTTLLVSPTILRPIIFILLILVALYTFYRKDLGVFFNR